jgi:AraC family transcriptional regulator, exoenzyme S synthesis regulatory protein ExsA
MLNVYDYITDSRLFKTFKVDDLLFVEYKCQFKERIGFWTHNNYFAYILGGTSRYISGKKEYNVKEGDAFFVSKGTYIADGHGPGDYCALMIFVPDDFIRSIVDKYPGSGQSSANGVPGNEEDGSLFPLKTDESLSAYFHSVLSYFPGSVTPSPALLKIKFEELLLNVLTNGQHPSLAAFLRTIPARGKISIRQVMQSSFMYNMSLEEYARLCARSLSAFKSEFYEIYNTSPGKWLINARLEYARLLMHSTEYSVNDVAFKSGFKNTSHFVRLFKSTYGVPPLQYRIKSVKDATVDEVAMAV